MFLVCVLTFTASLVYIIPFVAIRIFDQLIERINDYDPEK